MALVARTDPGTTINYGEHVFEFADGTRQVSRAEADVLERYVAQGGIKVVIEEETKKKGSGS